MLPLFFALWSAMRVIWFLPSFDNAFYLFIIVTLLAIMIKGRQERLSVDFRGVFLIYVCALSILCNNIPAVFRPWQRLVIWIVLLLLFGPFMKNKYLCHFRIQLFTFQQVIYVIIAIASFFGKFIGITRYQGSYFGGIASNSILLGIISANSLVTLAFFITRNYGELGAKRQWKQGVAVIIVILMMLAASSRSAVISGTLGTLPVLVELTCQKMSKSYSSIIYIVFLALLTIPLIGNYTVGIRQKNHGSFSSLDYSSREKLWDESISAFKENPFLGVGFSAIATEKGNLSKSGRVETGSSWLSVLAMTGSCGAAVIVAILVQAALQLFNLFKAKIPQASLLCGMLLCYMLNMCSEGYIFAGGSVLCLNFWLTLGTISAYNELYSANPAKNGHSLANDSRNSHNNQITASDTVGI